ncbi:MAG: hypothetical protein V1799_15525 [bacterium]
MEPETITIEINRETAQILSWLVVGVVLVSIAFFIPPESTELWPGLNLAMQVAAIYLLILLTYILREPIRKLHRSVMWLIFLFVLGATFYLSYRFEEKSKWHGQQLHRILGVIKDGIRTAEAPKILLNTLEAYHRKQMKQQKNLAETFKTLYPKAEVGGNLFISDYFPGYFWGHNENPLRIFLHSLEPGTIVLIAMDKFQEGKDPLFKNYDGKSGRSQCRYTLTEKGITYVTEN